ncbi:hypothetical protein L1049_003499 [Liquidambar formosana]|uniref:Uncharacterized protein n=1 Tax=Liquidambar formosana TaxID=63359 RepID=A0AAP0N3Y4_LIQFO
MLGTGLQFGHGEDRFYIPVKARKNQNRKQQQKRQSQRAQSNGNESSTLSTKSKVVNSDKRNPEESSNSMPKPSSEPSSTPYSNLDRFMEATTPLVPAQYFSETTMRGWRIDVEYQSYFTLGDLWESFKEWSAHGAGVRLILDGSDSVVQHYVPYLSGIQLYGESTRASAKLRQAGEDSDSDYCRDSSSDGSSDYEIEKGMRFFGEQQGHPHALSEVPLRMGALSLSDAQIKFQEGVSSDDGEAGNSQGHLLFEFFEQDPPYSREPLADKILDLARRCPELKTLRSCDLLPASWISVAWYPTYRKPTGPTLEDLDACFLTYHSLSTPIRGSGGSQAPVVIYPSEMDGIPKISLPVFGMASYKFKGSMWTQNSVCESQRVNSLMQAADNWLRLLQVNHPDFQTYKIGTPLDGMPDIQNWKEKKEKEKENWENDKQVSIPRNRREQNKAQE